MQQGSDDDCVYLPYTTVMRLSSQSMVDCYTAMMADESLANEAKSTMEEELMSILKTENGYYVYSASEWLEEMNKMINMVIVILTGIASISLLVSAPARSASARRWEQRSAPFWRSLWWKQPPPPRWAAF